MQYSRSVKVITAPWEAINLYPKECYFRYKTLIMISSPERRMTGLFTSRQTLRSALGDTRMHYLLEDGVFAVSR